MTLGASALGQVALGGSAVDTSNYVSLVADIGITSSIAAAINIAGRVELASSFDITSNVQCALTINGAVYGDVQLSAAIAMQSSFTAEISAAPAMPDAGVRFTLSDRAGGV